MKKYFPLFVVFVTGLTMANENKITPLPLPKKIRVESTVPRQKVWNTLTERQKLFAYHLIQAGREGKTLLAMQIHRHGLALQGILLASLSEANIKETKKLLGKEGFEEYLMYAAKFMDSSGPYASSNRKYTLLKTKNATFATLVNKHGANLPDATKKEIIALAGMPFSIASPKQLGEVLYDKLQLGGAKKSSKTGAYTTDAQTLEALAEEGHSIAAKVLEWRQYAKLKSTYTDALPTYVNPKTGRVHTSFSLASTTTGSCSSRAATTT